VGAFVVTRLLLPALAGTAAFATAYTRTSRVRFPLTPPGDSYCTPARVYRAHSAKLRAFQNTSAPCASAPLTGAAFTFRAFTRGTAPSAHFTFSPYSAIPRRL